MHTDSLISARLWITYDTHMDFIYFSPTNLSKICVLWSVNTLGIHFSQTMGIF